ncbi:MAG: PSD1 and planctomycete cytochrome C domain-containing protein, partial [Aureliella sp.]
MLSLSNWYCSHARWLRPIFIGLIVFSGAVQASADDPSLDFFEAEIRPILVDKCSGCHGPDKQEGELRIDLRDSILSGGDRGAAMVPGNAAASLLVKAIRHEDGLEMPPKEVLSQRAIEALEHWIDAGAPWPASQESLTVSTLKPADQAKEHWAFQPVRRPMVPEVFDDSGWIQSPVDAFVLEKLQSHGLSPSPPADRRSLIRRLSYTLTGLPPAFDEVQQFVDDESPRAVDDLVERLLASPHYGEHWARHWLDVARYSDTKGYVYAREERFWVHAWTYRDWVARAFNEDLPYDRFLLLQLAADQVSDRRQSDLAAMGFLTLGRRFLGVERDIIDDRIDVVCRGTMGLTVACARCHDHKYDPIPTADYYSLYGVFDSSVERLEPLAGSLGDEVFEAELKKRQDALQDRLVAARQESSDRVRARVADYLFAQSELDKYPANGFDQVFQADDLLPAFVRRWQRFLREAKRTNDPLFAAWQAYADLPAAEFATAAIAVTQQLQQSETIPAAIQRVFETTPQSFREVCDRYGEAFSQINERYKSQADDPQQISSIATEWITVLYGPQAPCQVPDGPVVLAETYFDSGVLTDLWKHQGEVDRWIINAPQPAPHALTLVDQAQPIEPRVFVRGNPLVQGADVPRQFLAALGESDRRPFEHGSGRYELAQDIIDPHNPLTARVLVNRVWTAHFGNGLVTTPSDFGTRAEAPSHPELLDWLTDNFISHGWSIKELHRWILLSSTYQQSSHGPADASVLSATVRLDPDNRLLWRMNPKRLG